jgi:HAE1 family hydrophobic/amphiphilic exporter-1
MSFIERIQNKPLTILTSFVILILIGGLMAGTLSVELMPDISIGVLAIQTPFPQAGPEEVESQLIIPLEERLAVLEGLQSMESRSMEHMGLIILWFVTGTDVDEKQREVEDLVKLIRPSLPSAIQDPRIIQFDPNSVPVMDLTLFGGRSVDELYNLAEDLVKPELERIPGVASVSISGGRQREIQVDVAKNRLEAHNLSLPMISNALAQQNLNLGAGSITEGTLDYILTTSGGLSSLEDIRRTVIHRAPLGGQSTFYPVLVRDVAQVRDGFAQQTSVVRINGAEGVSISIQAANGSNVVEISQAVNRSLTRVNNQLPGDVELRILGDNSLQVTSVLNTVLESTLIGVLMAVLVLALFLGRWSSTLIVAISIPVSLLITIAALAFTGRTFNMLTLGGMLLGLGMIVDGSIVVLENIDTYQKKGILPKIAALIGTQEMVGPVIGSILTSVSVFIPMFLLQEQMGIFGQLFGDLSFTIIAALASSLVVAVVLIPVLASITAKKISVSNPEALTKQKGPNALTRAINAMLANLERGYGWVLKGVVRVPWLTVVGAFVILGLSLLLVPQIGLVFSPPTPSNVVTLDVTLPAGTNLMTTQELMYQLETEVFAQIQEFDSVISTSGQGNSFSGRLRINLPVGDEATQNDEDVKNILRRVFPLFPQAQFEFVDSNAALGGAGGGVEVKLIGSPGINLQELSQTAEDLSRLLSSRVQGISEVRSTAAQSLPRIDIQIDRARAIDLGLNTASIAQEVRAQIAGMTATTFTQDSETLDVVVRLRPEDRNSEADLMHLFVMNNSGQRVALANVAHLVRTESPVEIRREGRNRVSRVNGAILPGFSVNQVQGEIESIIEQEFNLPPGIRVEFGGDLALLTESLEGMTLVLIVAVLLVFGVMVSQFESLRAPFIIIFAMPTMLTGVVLAYYLMNVSFSPPGMIGVIMLAGIVVNNGIILVDYSNLLRKRGLPIKEAAIQAGKSRLRPVLMTTLTTVLAMVPMAFFPGEGTEMLQPLGLTVVGGLSYNTLVTLVFIPAMYTIVYKDPKSKTKPLATSQPTPAQEATL